MRASFHESFNYIFWYYLEVGKLALWQWNDSVGNFIESQLKLFVEYIELINAQIDIFYKCYRLELIRSGSISFHSIQGELCVNWCLRSQGLSIFKHSI